MEYKITLQELKNRYPQEFKSSELEYYKSTLESFLNENINHPILQGDKRTLRDFLFVCKLDFYTDRKVSLTEYKQITQNIVDKFKSKHGLKFDFLFFTNPDESDLVYLYSEPTKQLIKQKEQEYSKLLKDTQLMLMSGQPIYTNINDFQAILKHLKFPPFFCIENKAVQITEVLDKTEKRFIAYTKRNGYGFTEINPDLQKVSSVIDLHVYNKLFQKKIAEIEACSINNIFKDWIRSLAY